MVSALIVHFTLDLKMMEKVAKYARVTNACQISKSCSTMAPVYIVAKLILPILLGKAVFKVYVMTGKSCRKVEMALALTAQTIQGRQLTACYASVSLVQRIKFL